MATPESLGRLSTYGSTRRKNEIRRESSMRNNVKLKPAKKTNKSVIALLSIITLGIYLIIPPQDKIAQIGYIFNNIKFSMCGQETEEYIFHRNNAIYLTRMENPKSAIIEMDKAVATLPNSIGDKTLFELYKDRAKIKMYYGDYKGALNDYLRIPSHGLNDYLAIAMLLKENGKRKLAISYCNKILDIDIKAYAGYACIADVYASADKYEAAVMIYDLLIDRSPNKAKYYADRAMYKEKAGDMIGAAEDHKKAEDLSPLVDYNSSITYEILHPKKLNLSIL